MSRRSASQHDDALQTLRTFLGRSAAQKARAARESPSRECVKCASPTASVLCDECTEAYKADLGNLSRR